MKSALKLGAALVVIGAAVWFYPPLRGSALYVAGRASVCPLSRAMEATDAMRVQTEVKDRIVAASKVVEEDPAGFKLWDTPQGRFWMPRGSDYSLHWGLAEQERRIYGVGERGVRAGDIVLDCGANVGGFTRACLRDGAKKVIAIELAPENIECLNRNFASEIAEGRVVVYPKGVWDKDDVLTLNVSPENSPADSVVIKPKGAQEGPKVPLTTIDKIVSELNLERVDFIKMDIEGAEQNALIGARQTLAKFHPRMGLAAYHRPDDPAKIPELVRAAWPEVRMECGPCAEANGSIRPDVINFY